MIRLALGITLDYEVFDPGCDFIFNIHAAHTGRQQVVHEALTLSQQIPVSVAADPVSRNRYMRLRALPGPLSVNYLATVDIDHHVGQSQQIAELPVAQLPTSVLGYIYPSRYCQSDRLQNLANREFGHLQPGYARVQAVRDWVRQRTAFTANTSNSATSAIDTLLEHVGVCRDFAHLMIALCRALNIPDRKSVV